MGLCSSVFSLKNYIFLTEKKKKNCVLFLLIGNNYSLEFSIFPIGCSINNTLFIMLSLNIFPPKEEQMNYLTKCYSLKSTLQRNGLPLIIFFKNSLSTLGKNRCILFIYQYIINGVMNIVQLKLILMLKRYENCGQEQQGRRWQ